MAGGQAPLHRAPRRPPPARARRDVLQLGDHADPPPHLLGQRPHLRPRHDLDRADRLRPADLPQLLPGPDAVSATASAASSATSAGPSRSPTSSATSTGCVESARRAVGPPRAEPPDPGARLGLLPEQGRLRARARSSTGTRSCRSPSPSCTTRTGGSRSTRSLLEEEQISVLFSLSRAYFMVDMEVPSGYVEFLRSMTPARARRRALHADRARQAGQDALLPRPAASTCTTREDAFVEAPGMRGQVMLVFTLPSYPYVFKVIRDVVRPRQGHRPGDRALEVRAGQARRPRRAAGRHARVHRRWRCRATASRPELLERAARRSRRR